VRVSLDQLIFTFRYESAFGHVVEQTMANSRHVTRWIRWEAS
jgi:hypothetical protein